MMCPQENTKDRKDRTLQRTAYRCYSDILMQLWDLMLLSGHAVQHFEDVRSSGAFNRAPDSFVLIAHKVRCR